MNSSGRIRSTDGRFAASRGRSESAIPAAGIAVLREDAPGACQRDCVGDGSLLPADECSATAYLMASNFRRLSNPALCAQASQETLIRCSRWCGVNQQTGGRLGIVPMLGVRMES